MMGSRPVRVGNAATERLDVYGEVIDAATHFVRTGGTFDRETNRMHNDGYQTPVSVIHAHLAFGVIAFYMVPAR